jgi:hypothetical protein
MSSKPLFTCPYHDVNEEVPGVPYLLECGCKCMQAFDKKADADRSAEEEGGQVVEHELNGHVKHIVVLYIPTAILMPE